MLRPFLRPAGLTLLALCACAAPILADGAASPTMNVKDFGAAGDGKTLDTDAFKKAIEACHAAGGGTVVVPPGTFVTGPVQLLSNINLHVAEGATLLFDRNLSTYPLVRSNWEGRDTYMPRSPLWADNAEHISVTGGGIIDGSGDAWRMIKRTKLTPEQWDKQVASGGYVDPAHSDTWYPSRSVFDLQGSRDNLDKLRSASGEPQLADFQKFHDLLRPSLVLFSNCTHVTLDGPTFRNSPSWNVHLLYCENVTVHHVTLFNEIWAQNGDGIDLDSCRNVEMSQSTVYAGDDDICLKSGRDEAGRKTGKPTENVTIRDCDIYWGHGGVVIGSEMSGGVRNVTVSNCIMRGTDIGLRFKTTRGRGGVVENVDVSNVAMHDIKGPAIVLDMYYMTKSHSVEPVSERTPTFRRFNFRNITCEGAKSAMEIRGLPEQAISGMSFDTVRISADKGVTITDAEDITLRDVRITSKTDPALQTTQNVKNLTLDRVSTQTTAPPTYAPALPNSDTSTDATPPAKRRAE